MHRAQIFFSYHELILKKTYKNLVFGAQLITIQLSTDYHLSLILLFKQRWSKA